MRGDAHELLDEPGRFKADCVEWSIQETRASKLPQWVCRFQVTEYWAGEEWKPWTGPNQITGYFVLVKKNGELNTFGINALKEALGWSGLSFADLAVGDWGSVQITVEWEQNQKGENELRVKFINPLNWIPRKKSLDSNGLRDLDAKWKGKLLAGKQDDLHIPDSSIPKDGKIPF